MKINLGSNNVRHGEFLNVDIRQIQGVDIVDNVFELKTIKEESVEHIIAHNILEHIAPDKTLDCVKLWVSKLKKPGIIEIGVPDGELIFERYKKGIVTREQYKNMPWMDVIHSIFGNMKLEREWHGDDAEKYMHHTLFCEKYLRYIMDLCKLYEIQKTRPNHLDNITLIGKK